MPRTTIAQKVSSLTGCVQKHSCSMWSRSIQIILFGTLSHKWVISAYSGQKWLVVCARRVEYSDLNLWIETHSLEALRPEEIDAIAGRFGFGEGCADTLSRENPVKVSKSSPRSIPPKRLVALSKVVEQVRASQLARSSRKVMRSSVKQPGDLRGWRKQRPEMERV